MLIKARLLTFLLDSLAENPTSKSGASLKSLSQEDRNKDICRGLILNCINAIRLQADALSPDSFLRQFLSAHAQYNTCLLPISTSTLPQQAVGFGLNVMDGNGNKVDIHNSETASSISLLSGLSFGSSNNDGTYDGVGVCIVYCYIFVLCWL